MSAAMVAIKSSGQIMVVMIEAGTTIPPIPSPAMTRRTHSVDKLCLVAHASAPHPIYIVQWIGAGAILLLMLSFTYQLS